MIANQIFTTIDVLGLEEALSRIQNTLVKDDRASFDTLNWMRHKKTLDYKQGPGLIDVSIGHAPFERHAPFSVFLSTLAHLCENSLLRQEVFREEHELIVDTSRVFGDDFIVFGVDLNSSNQSPRIRRTQNLDKKDLRLYRMVWLP